MINLNAIGQFFSGISKALGAIGHVVKALTGILNSPIGMMIKAAFPPLAAAAGILSFVGMLGDVSNMVGGKAAY